MEPVAAPSIAEVVTTSGRRITPPKIRVTSQIVAKKDSIKADEWLLAEAKKENERDGGSRADFQKGLLDAINPKRMSQADKDTAWMVLTGDPDAPSAFELVGAEEPTPPTPESLADIPPVKPSKPPWEMTKDEFLGFTEFGDVNDYVEIIAAAIKIGKTIPQTTLDEYHKLLIELTPEPEPEVAVPTAAEVKRAEKAIAKERKKEAKAKKKSELEAVHEKRTERSQAMDESKAHSQVLAVDDPETERWKTKPGSADVRGIDTFSKKRKVTKKKKKSKKRTPGTVISKIKG
ncbi:hypothetical protein LCGC14_0721150 [marine sediment metagenome]|uniref:Uncharacterized protein n=1 Tax=marine sediment metagenome TaxID=412755 RepID=A0A0F9QCC3_9ZZZZ